MKPHRKLRPSDLGRNDKNNPSNSEPKPSWADLGKSKFKKSKSKSTDPEAEPAHDKAGDVDEDLEKSEEPVKGAINGSRTKSVNEMATELVTKKANDSGGGSAVEPAVDLTRVLSCQWLDNSATGEVVMCTNKDCEHRQPPQSDFLESKQYELEISDFSMRVQNSQTWNELADSAVVSMRRLCGAKDVIWIEFAAQGERILWWHAGQVGWSRKSKLTYEHLLKDVMQIEGASKSLGRLIAKQDGGVAFLSDMMYQGVIETSDFYRKFMKNEEVSDIAFVQCYWSNVSGSVVLCVMLPPGFEKPKIRRRLEQSREPVRCSCEKLSRLASFSNIAKIMRELCKVKDHGLLGISHVANDGETILEADETSMHLISKLGGYMGPDDQLILPEHLIKWVRTTMHRVARLVAQTRERQEMSKSWEAVNVHTRLYVEQSGHGCILVCKQTGDEKNVLGDVYDKLTPREFDVLRSISRGGTNQHAAEALNISIRTVEKHLQRIFNKLGVTERTQAIHLYLSSFKD